MWYQEPIIIGLINSVFSLIAITIGGSFITAMWTRQQKQREIDNLELGKLYQLYGSYLSIRRMWNVFKKKPSICPSDDATQWNFLKQATETECALESILVKVASERRLAPQDEAKLGAFRQSFQALRQSINKGEKGEPLEWDRSEHPEYVAFKEGATYLASLLERPRLFLSKQRAAKSLLEITSNKYEKEAGSR